MHENDLVTALRTLRDNLPRTMVNLLTPPSKKMSELFRINNFTISSSNSYESVNGTAWKAT